MKTYFPEVLQGYRRKSILGSGSQSQVWLYTKDRINYAVKYDTGEPDVPEHKNICKVIERISLDKHKWIVMEYLGAISIVEIVELRKVPIDRAKKWYRDLCNALEFIHKKGIVHGDIKCENVMIQGKSPKIVDWGFSRHISEPIKGIGSLEYCAPELIDDEDGVDAVACDIWSLNVLFFCMVFSIFPFSGRNDEEMLKSIRLMKVPKNLADDAKDEREYFLWCFQERPTIKEILAHKWIRE